MSKVKAISFESLKKDLFANEEFKKAFDEINEDELSVEIHLVSQKKTTAINSYLRNLRKEAGLTAQQLAERMNISQPAVSRIERNAYKASIETLERYANACGRSVVNDLLAH